MPFYWMAVKPWVSDMKRVVACIEIAGKNKKLMDLSDVKCVNDLMIKKAMPIRNIKFKYAKQGDDKNKRTEAGDLELEPLFGYDETLGETLERMKRIKKAKRKKRNQYHRRSTTTYDEPQFEDPHVTTRYRNFGLPMNHATA